MKYVKSLDGVRGWAILLVIWFHFFFLVQCGWIGVQLFFVLSGYLITTILLKSKDSSLSFYLKRFYWRRSLRIFPLYFAYVFLFLGTYLVFSFPSDMADNIAYLLTYTYNFKPLIEGDFVGDPVFTPFWSLSVEEQFYLVWPFVVFFAGNRALKWIVAGILFVSPLVRFFLADMLLQSTMFNEEAIGETVYRFTLGQLDAFAFGAALPVFSLAIKWRDHTGKIALATASLMLIAGLWNYFDLMESGMPLMVSSLGYKIGVLDNMQHVWSYTLINMAATGLILFLVTYKGNRVTRGLFENKVLVMIGKVSYGMYVYHWVLLSAYRQTIHPRIGNELLSMVIYVGLVFLIAYLSFEVFEKRFLEIKDKKFSLKGGKPSISK